MKPPLFEYIAPSSLDEAVAARAAHANGAVLAGGQSLVPTLNFRIAAPDALIDLRRVPGLADVTIENGAIRIGAMVRQRRVERDDAVHRANPVIREALGHVAHIVIRNRGTVVGSLAHGDAAAELPTLLLATGGAVVAQGPAGTRTIPASALYQFHLTTSVAPDEILTEARFPVLPPRSGAAFDEFTRRHGDYALAGVCALVTLADDGSCADARLAACGVAATPVRLEAAERCLIGSDLEPATLAEAGDAARASVTAADDSQASTAFRQHLTAGLVRQCVARAAARAAGCGGGE